MYCDKMKANTAWNILWNKTELNLNNYVGIVIVNFYNINFDIILNFSCVEMRNTQPLIKLSLSSLFFYADSQMATCPKALIVICMHL